MLTKEDTLTKKITLITGLLIAITGLIAAWTAFVKVYNPPPPDEAKAKQAYSLLKEKLEFQEMVLQDTRDTLREVKQTVWMAHMGGRSPASMPEPAPRMSRRGSGGHDDDVGVMSETEADELIALETLELGIVLDEPAAEVVDDEPAVVQQQVVDPLMSKAKPLPSKLK